MEWINDTYGTDNSGAPVDFHQCVDCKKGFYISGQLCLPCANGCL